MQPSISTAAQADIEIARIEIARVETTGVEIAWVKIAPSGQEDQPLWGGTSMALLLHLTACAAHRRYRHFSSRATSASRRGLLLLLPLLLLLAPSSLSLGGGEQSRLTDERATVPSGALTRPHRAPARATSGDDGDRASGKREINEKPIDDDDGGRRGWWGRRENEDDEEEEEQDPRQ
ncbi:unnamed protein product [Lampetra planeri]